MPHKLHERALRLHIADARALVDDDNPWLDREDGWLIAPLLVKLSHALADVLEYLVDTDPPELAYDAARRLLHQHEAALPAPLLPLPCECSACLPDSGESTSPAVRYYTERAMSRLMEPRPASEHMAPRKARGAVGSGDTTEPIRIIAA